MAIEHESLGAVELEAIAGASRGHRGFVRMMLCEFVDGQRSDQIAGNDSRQVSFFLLVSTRASDCCRIKNRSREKRGGRQRATQFLRHDAGLDVPESQAAVVLGNQNSRPAHLDEIFPTPRENPSASRLSRSARRCATGAFLGKKPRALSRSIVCSSLRTNAISDYAPGRPSMRFAIILS